MPHAPEEVPTPLPAAILAAVELTDPDIVAALELLDERVELLPPSETGDLSEFKLDPYTIAEDTVNHLLDE